MPFFTDKSAKERIAELDTQIESLEADSITAQERITALESEAVNKDQTICEHVATIGTAETAATEAGEKITALETNLEASQKETIETRESVGKQVAEALSGIGQPEPLKIDSGDATGNESNEVTRAEFNAMTPRAKSDFSRNGGKIK
jgi:septal ring factor EnvC (AmiA/AmiB activator)